MPDVDEAVRTVEEAADSRPMGWLARTGLAARGIVYLLMGWLAVLVALGGRQHVDQRGALTEVVAAPFGGALVLLLGLGFAAYALWRFSEVAFGVTGEGDGAGPRLKALARALVYSLLAVTAFSVLSGAKGTQADQQGSIAADVMSRTGGRWLVGLVGAAVVVVGLVMVREGWSKKFVRYFGSVPPGVRRWIIPLGRIGTVSRGVVLAIAGVLVIAAAVTAQASKAGGVDAAFRTLLEQPSGPLLVALLGLGLVVFGVYGLAEAAYRRVPGEQS
jgi:hypothetical protein